MTFKFIALFAAALTSTGLVPQIIKGLRTKSVKDLSIVTLVFSAVGTFLWAIYGFYLMDNIIIGANIFTCSTAITLIIMKITCRQD